jgi:hypothetical protein
MLIDFNYPTIKNFIIYFLFGPFMVYHTLFVVWADNIYTHIGVSQNYDHANWVILIILLVISAYFISNEVRQLLRRGVDYYDYFTSVWNYVDFFSPLGVTTCVAIAMY